MRRFAAPVELALVRLRRRPARGVLVCGGIALAAAMAGAVLIGSVFVRDRTVRHALSQLPASQRTLRVDTSGIGDTPYGASDRTATRALSLITRRAPLRSVEVRDLRFGVQLVRMLGVEGLSKWVRIRSGRAPRSCGPARCEVLQLGSGRALSSISAPGIKLDVVGTGSLVPAAPFGSLFQPVRRGPTLLIANGVRGLISLPGLDLIDRTYSWIVPLEPSAVHAWQVDRLLARESRAQSFLGQGSALLVLSAPDQPLQAAAHDGRVAAARMLLLGGEAVTLLLVFALLASAGLRRTLVAERQRLEQRGARAFQLAVFVAAETGALTLAGWAIGAAAAVIAAVALGGGTLLTHSLLTALGLSVLLAGWIVTTLLFAIPAWRSADGQKWARAVDVAALGALAAAIVGLSRGTTGAGNLTGGGALLFLLPGLLSFTAAVLAVRLTAPLLRLTELATRRRGVRVRLAIVALARAPRRTATAVAFLVVSVGLAVLASSYRATLSRGIHDESAFRVPLDFTLSEGTQLVTPLEAASVRQYEQLARGVRAYPILRRPADVAGTGTSTLSPDALGLPPSALVQLRGWRADYASTSRTRLAMLMGRGDPPLERGPILPKGVHVLRIRARARGVPINTDLVLETPHGVFVRVPLQGNARYLTGDVHHAAGTRVVALEISPTLGSFQSFQHAAAEGQVSGALNGTLTLEPLLAGNRVVTRWTSWLARDGARVRSQHPLQLQYDFASSQTVLLRPRQATDGRPFPVIVSPDVAAAVGRGNVIPLTFQDETVLGRIVAVARRFPTTQDAGGSFVLADESQLATALNADAPGSGTPLELWLRVPNGSYARVAAKLRSPPFDSLVLASRRSLAHELAAVPTARATLVILGLAALLAGILALGGVWLTVLADLRDERNELYDLEAEGVAPSALRAQLRLRASGVTVAGALGGIAFGFALSSVVVRLVHVTAESGTPVPPLVRVFGWPVIALAFVALVLLGVALTEGSARTAFHEDVPRRPVGP